ncbi:MAG TPA: helix-turn-helix domain-containing protein [Ktedonobacteraceae bacterium]
MCCQRCYLEQRLQQPSTPFKKRKKPRTVHEQAISDAAREQSFARYEEVLSYYQQGLSITQIAKQAHLTRTTVYKYLIAERCARTPSTIPISWNGQTYRSLHRLSPRAV